jgi:uncharacterized protein involved in exopolysaccharide biosynthesis
VRYTEDSSKYKDKPVPIDAPSPYAYGPDHSHDRIVPAFPPREPQPPVEDDSVSLVRVVLDLWEWRLLIAAAIVVSGVAALVLGVLAPKRYEALATVFVTPRTFSSELKPPPFSIEAFDRLAKSDYVTARVVDAAKKQGIVGPNGPSIGFSTVLYDSRETGKPYLPLIGLLVSAPDPAVAQQGANLWARIFIEEEQKFSSVGKAASIDFILSEYPKASSDLGDRQRSLTGVLQEQAKGLSTMKIRLSPEFITKQLEASQLALIEAEDDLRSTNLSLQESEKRLAELKTALASTPQRLTTAKAVSDEAIWAAVKSGQPGTPALPSTKLLSEEVNPVHTSLSGDLASEQVTTASLRARSAGLAADVKRLRSDIAGLTERLYRAQYSIEDLQRTQKLQASTFERAVEDAKGRVTRLEGKVVEAQLAKAERDSDVKLGAGAELPTSPSGPNVARNAVLAMGVGGALGVAAAWLLSQIKAYRRTRSVRPAAAV